MITTIERLAAEWPCTNAEYHADLTHDSNSSLNEFLKSVELYAAIRVFKSMQRPAPTPAMVFGTAFHAYLFEPCSFDKEYVIAPTGINRRTNAGKEAWAEFENASAGKTILEAEDLERLKAMREAVYRNKLASNILEKPGRIETAWRWTDPVSGVALKFRADKVLDCGPIVDLKTTGDIDPKSWAKSVANFGYHRQAWLYLDGAHEVGLSEGPFVHLVVSKDPPHESAVYAVGAKSLDLGGRQMRRTLDELALRRETKDWSGRWQDDIHEIEVPNWAFYDEE